MSNTSILILINSELIDQETLIDFSIALSSQIHADIHIARKEALASYHDNTPTSLSFISLLGRDDKSTCDLNNKILSECFPKRPPNVVITDDTASLPSAWSLRTKTIQLKVSIYGSIRISGAMGRSSHTHWQALSEPLLKYLVQNYSTDLAPVRAHEKQITGHIKSKNGEISVEWKPQTRIMSGLFTYPAKSGDAENLTEIVEMLYQQNDTYVSRARFASLLVEADCTTPLCHQSLTKTVSNNPILLKQPFESFANIYLLSNTIGLCQLFYSFSQKPKINAIVTNQNELDLATELNDYIDNLIILSYFFDHPVQEAPDRFKKTAIIQKPIELPAIIKQFSREHAKRQSNILLKAFGGDFDALPELPDRETEGIIYTDEQKNKTTKPLGQSTNFHEFISDFSHTVKYILLNESLYYCYKDMIERAELSNNPEELLLSSLKDGVRYHVK